MQSPSDPAAAQVRDFAIESMAYGGKGIARVDGKVWFVEGAIPGDEVRARVTEDSGRYCDAEILEIRKPSALRESPRCGYASRCGGCQWMGVDSAHQLDWKRQFVETSLKRIGKLGAEVPIEILPAPEVFAYRNRVLMRVHLDETGLLAVGYFRRGTRELVAVDRCEIAAAPINALLVQLQAEDWHGCGPLKARLEVQEIPPATTDSPAGRLVVTVYPAEGARERMDAFVQRLAVLPGVHWAGLVFDLAKAPAVLFDRDLGVDFYTIPGQFQQVNVAHNRTLRRLVQSKVDELAPQRILDVFCGSGNLSLPLADGTRYVEGVEANRMAITCARKNVEANDTRNTCYLTGDAEKHLWKCARGGETFDLVLLDPPRQGMYQGMVPLKKIAPRSIIYVSCDPTTLARDLGYLCRKDAYVIERVVALDFFPNTYHVETVAFLRRSE